MSKIPDPNKNAAAPNGPTRSASLSYAAIAKAAGVSSGLISAFFSGNQYSSERKKGIGISEAKRKKIKDICRKLNYIPENPHAYYILYPEKADVAILMNEDVTDGFSNPYHSLVFEGLAKRAFEKEVELSNLFFRSDHDYMIRPEALPNPLLRSAIKKVGLTGRPNYSLICQLLRMDVALVIVGNSVPMDGIVSVVPDFREAGRLGMQILVEHGHRSILVAAPHPMSADRYNGRMMREGCRQAAREYEVDFAENRIFELGPQTMQKEIIDVLSASQERPTAIFSFDDNQARQITHLLEKAGYSIPRDISILSCNDDRINQETPPGLSTIHLPCRAVGRTALDELNRIALEGRPIRARTVCLPVHFVDHGTLRSIV